MKHILKRHLKKSGRHILALKRNHRLDEQELGKHRAEIELHHHHLSAEEKDALAAYRVLTSKKRRSPLWLVAGIILILVLWFSSRFIHAQTSVFVKGAVKGSTAGNTATVTATDANHNSVDVNCTTGCSGGGGTVTQGPAGASPWLVSGNVAVSWAAAQHIIIDSSFYTLGQKTMANSTPVTIASDQSNLPTDPQGPDAQAAAQTGKPLQNGGRNYSDGKIYTIAVDANGVQQMNLSGLAVACSGLPALTGDVTTASGACATTIAANAVTQSKVTGGYVTTDATAQNICSVKTWTVNANLFSINGGIFMADQYSGATGKLKIENCMLTNLGYRFCIAPMGLDASSNIAATTAPANSYVLDMRGAATVQTGQNCMYCFWGGPNGGGAARWFYGFAANRANDFPFSRMFIYNELTTTEWGGGYPLGADLVMLARGASDLHLVNDASSTTQVATTSVTLGTSTSVAVTSTANFPTPNTSLWGVAPNYGTLTVSDSSGANIEFLSGVVGSPCNLALIVTNGTYCIQDATHFIIKTAISHTQPYNISQQGRTYFDIGRVTINAKAFAGDTQKRTFWFTDSSANLNNTLGLPSDTSATGAAAMIQPAIPLAITEVAAPSGVSGFDLFWADSTAHTLKANMNNVGAVTLATIVASGTSAMTTAGIATGACGTTVTTAATNALTTDKIDFTRNAAATNGNGGNLILNSWLTAGNVNWNYCNPSAGTVTPTAMTVNWAVMR